MTPYIVNWFCPKDCDREGKLKEVHKPLWLHCAMVRGELIIPAGTHGIFNNTGYGIYYSRWEVVSGEYTIIDYEYSCKLKAITDCKLVEVDEYNL